MHTAISAEAALGARTHLPGPPRARCGIWRDPPSADGAYVETAGKHGAASHLLMTMEATELMAELLVPSFCQDGRELGAGFGVIL